MVENSTLVTEKPKLIFPVFKLALFWTIVSIILIAPISLEVFRLKAFEDFYRLILLSGLLAESNPGDVYVQIIGFFILLPIIVSTFLGILAVYFKKIAFSLFIFLPLLVIISLVLMIQKNSSSSPPEIVAIPISIFTPLVTIAWLSISNVIIRPGNAILNSLKAGAIALIIAAFLAMLFPFMMTRTYIKAKAEELGKLKSENTFLKRPTYLPSNLTIRSNEEMAVDQGLWWNYTCKVQNGGSATLYIKQVPIGEYAHNLAWFESPEFQTNKQAQFSQATINGKMGLYSEPTAQNWGWKSLWWESNGIFLEIESDSTCTHSKNDLLKIAESMEHP